MISKTIGYNGVHDIFRHTHLGMDMTILKRLVVALPSGKRLHSELERSTIFDGKIHYFYGHFQ